MRATIRDVAKRAGVSPATVSRVLNGKNYVDSEKESRILEAIADLEYVPNALARNLGRQKADTIGVAALRGNQLAFSNPFFPEVIRGISQVTERENQQILLNNYDNMAFEIQNCMNLGKSGSVDGFVLLTSRVHDELIAQLMKQRINFVLIGRVMENTLPDYEKVYLINTDNIKSSAAVVTHLIQQGAKKIGIIAAPMKYVVSNDRYLGYRQTLLANGLKFDDALCVDGGYTFSDAKSAMNRLLDEVPDLDAVFATDDMKGVAAIQTIQQRGKSVPQDILVAGHGGFEIGEIIVPNLTTISVPVFELGRAAAEMLLQLIGGNPPKERGKILDTKLIIRESSVRE